ncbi:MAG: M6 family metalloprotease domain-containing protein [Candidatus Hodarchaeales archaeon]|jgi:immune inhibitor A
MGKEKIVRWSNIRLVPPTLEVMTIIYMEYRRILKERKISFNNYLKEIGYDNPAVSVKGMDDAVQLRVREAGPELIDIPQYPISGKLHVKVLLIDFSDCEGYLPLEHYQDLLFSKNEYPTGSLHDYYKEVSLGNVEITGSIHGWIRLPEPYSYYTNNQSGTNSAAYPRNAQRMAEDAVIAALHDGVEFKPELDLLNQGIITALFLIHAGQGAESLHPSIRGNDIWSHKWFLKEPIEVNPAPKKLHAGIYLTVPQNCKIGVCAHELGHLAFQWQDFYDPNYDEDGHFWDGSGRWDLMASGSYNGNDGDTPAHPAGLHKMQHNWIKVERVSSSKSITLEPYSANSGKVVLIEIPNHDIKEQYLLLENRIKKGFDFYLPGEGLLVWRIDERARMIDPSSPGLFLIQADGRHNLEDPYDWNQGDAGDPFPGSENKDELLDTGDVSTSFPNQPRSGVKLLNITLNPDNNRITLDVEIQ